MATRRARPGRTLIIFFLGVAVIYGLVALAGSWKPSLGLDLQGGTRITLTAEGNPTDENLEEARRILDQRVNGRGIEEAEVTTQGGKYVVVEVPGKTENRAQLEETVRRQAQLRFRLVACADGFDESLCSQGGGMQIPGMGRPAPFSATEPTDPVSSGTPKQQQSQSADPTSPAGPGASPSAPAGDPWNTKAERTVEDELQWMNAPDQQSIQLYNAVQCGPDGTVTRANKKNQQVPANLRDNPNTPIVACEVMEGKGDAKDSVVKYLLSRSVIEGTELDDAAAVIPQGEVNWAVSIELGNSKEKARPKGTAGAADDFEKISRALVGTQKLFAIVLDGQVLSAPRMTSVITNGDSQITGDFSETEATDLANSLKFGALPIAFSEEDTSVEDIGPSLAGDQLSTGLLAGGIGLGLVMLYCLLYYRGLGAVVVMSLFVAAGVTFAMVLLLSETAGFTLTLPGMAGFIVAVGIVADSFVIYFERIRDEMREGKSMRVAVETGWARARVTRIAANTVSLLSATVLYIFATGAVKGFGFALGLSTLIDLAVLFWFTKPLVSYLAQYKLFNSGHRLSGLSRATLGIDEPATAGGKA